MEEKSPICKPEAGRAGLAVLAQTPVLRRRVLCLWAGEQGVPPPAPSACLLCSSGLDDATLTREGIVFTEATDSNAELLADTPSPRCAEFSQLLGFP